LITRKKWPDGRVRREYGGRAESTGVETEARTPASRAGPRNMLATLPGAAEAGDLVVVADVQGVARRPRVERVVAYRQAC
jgi:hypothetical protein